MSWEAISAIAELVGALGVVATLVFLAFQIRQNSKLLEHNTRQLEQNHRVAVAQALSESIQQSEAMLAIAQNADLSDIVFRGLRDYGALSPLERMRFASVLGPMMGGIANKAVQQLELDIHGHPMAPDNLVFALGYLNSNGGRQWWDRYKVMYPQAFQVMLDKALQERASADSGTEN